MTRLSDIPPGSSITGCIYGPSGSGKSWMMGTANSSKVIYGNVESRLATFQSPAFKSRFPQWNPIIITVSEGVLPITGAKALDEISTRLRDELIAHENEVDIVIIDGATAMRRFAMNKGLELNLKTKKSETISKMKQLGSELPFVATEINDYTAEMQLIAGFIYKMKEYCFEANKHFFMTAHERIQYNKPSKIGDIPTVHSIKPGFTGQTFPDDIPGLFDLVWHTETKGAGELVKYYARTAGDSALVAKTCYNGLFPTMLENPNLQQIIAKIQGR